jgi:hypothetical protein
MESKVVEISYRRLNEAIAHAAGAIFEGIQDLPHGKLYLFACPRCHSTLACAEKDYVPSHIRLKLSDHALVDCARQTIHREEWE